MSRREIEEAVDRLISEVTLPRNLRTLDGHEPHPSYGGWENFLRKIELRDEHDGVLFFGSSNCNYIVFPDGTVIENFGFNGPALMSRVRDEGWQAVLASFKASRTEWDSALARFDRI